MDGMRCVRPEMCGWGEFPNAVEGQEEIEWDLEKEVISREVFYFLRIRGP